MNMSLNKFFTAIGTSKQSFHAKLDRQMSKNEAMAQLELVVMEVRKDHPGMNLRDLHRLIAPEPSGALQTPQVSYALTTLLRVLSWTVSTRSG